MKFSLIATIAVVLAIGSESASLVKRQTPDMLPELEKISKYFVDMVDSLKVIEAPMLADRAKAYIEESKAQLQPMVENIQQQLKPLSGNIEEQFKPLTDSMQTQFSSYSNLMQTQVEDLFKFVVDQTKTILPPQ